MAHNTSTPVTKAPSYFISAGEPSGDLLGGPLVAELAKQLPEHKPFGVCGEHMLAAGVEAIEHIDNLSVMGFAEVIAHLPRILRIEKAIMAEIERRQPEVAILIDYPGLHLRMAAKIRGMGIKVVQYVAPQLWAWGQNRTEKLKRVTDLVLGIMPFEEQFFLDREVNYRYVGTPQVERAEKATLYDFQKPFAHDTGPLIGFFPGSRLSELRRILPKIAAIYKEMAAGGKDESLRFVLSIAPYLGAGKVSEVIAESFPNAEPQPAEVMEWDIVPGQLKAVRGRSLDLMKTCSTALVTSGTATLECALVGTPMAVIYVTSPLTYAIGKRVVKLPHISLVNLVAERGLVREFVQEFEPATVAEHLGQLTLQPRLREQAHKELTALSGRLKGNLAHHAATEIRNLLLPS